MRESEKYELDPVYLHARREAVVILSVFLLFALFTLGISFGLGRQPDDQDLSQFRVVLGMPAWVAWGVVLPWIIANVVTAWFCFGFMEQDDLDPEPQPLESQQTSELDGQTSELDGQSSRSGEEYGDG